MNTLKNDLRDMCNEKYGSYLAKKQVWKTARDQLHETTMERAAVKKEMRNTKDDPESCAELRTKLNNLNIKIKELQHQYFESQLPKVAAHDAYWKIKHELRTLKDGQ